jgi:hypothetical protein
VSLEDVTQEAQLDEFMKVMKARTKKGPSWANEKTQTLKKARDTKEATPRGYHTRGRLGLGLAEETYVEECR